MRRSIHIFLSAIPIILLATFVLVAPTLMAVWLTVDPIDMLSGGTYTSGTEPLTIPNLSGWVMSLQILSVVGLAAYSLRQFFKMRKLAGDPSNVDKHEFVAEFYPTLAVTSLMGMFIYMILIYAAMSDAPDLADITLSYLDLVTKGMFLDFMETYNIDIGDRLEVPTIVQFYQFLVRTLHGVALGMIVLFAFTRARAHVDATPPQRKD